MGKPVRGWEHTGEMNAVQPDSGAKATIFVDAETNRVGLVSSDDGELGKMVQLSVFAHALYDELHAPASGVRLAAPPRPGDSSGETPRRSQAGHRGSGRGETARSTLLPAESRRRGARVAATAAEA